jgi:hypothetical protein
MSRASTTSASRSSRGSRAAGDGGLLTGYLARSARPLTSLVFLLPFIVIYELGTRLLSDPVKGTQHIVAFTMMQQFFALFGAYGRHLPAMAVVAILLAWHIARRDAWSVSLPTLLTMIIESVALAWPLILFGVLLTRFLPLAATTAPGPGQAVVLSLGAGVYEELVFRLILCTTLAMVLKNALKMDPRLSMLLLVFLSATLFSAYHYLGNEAFHWRIFVFRMAAGVYFAGLFVSRGFGITAGSHMAYDILIVVL